MHISEKRKDFKLVSKIYNRRNYKNSKIRLKKIRKKKINIKTEIKEKVNRETGTTKSFFFFNKKQIYQIKLWKYGSKRKTKGPNKQY